MFMECENLLKKFLILNPSDRVTLTEIPKNPWMNGDNEEELNPHIKPPPDYKDPWQTELMVFMGYT
ncbi:hypothetical protein E2I00_017186 [Balaenoptera physalus]|uniref:Protein kinase domain-containing protein n=1 Tax=Balaenoptera physalus TaxID=9770 RepID=A0A643BKD3_BALPH|nr:hypothetical protein E2I00_017186 [Balaenoptera physalus]